MKENSHLLVSNQLWTLPQNMDLKRKRFTVKNKKVKVE